MGTRADFYIGRGEQAEWLGSIAWDGYPSGVPAEVLHAENEEWFRNAVTEMVTNRDDGTKPEQGWPWPWETSSTTDYAYAWDEDRVWASSFGNPWFDAKHEPEPDEETGEVDYSDGLDATFPDMSGRQATTLGARSGLMIFGVPK